MKIYRPTALFAADLHIRHIAPRCREQAEFIDSQAKKINFLTNTQQKYGVPLIIAGDFGNKAQWPNMLISYYLALIINDFNLRRIVIPGQHDLPEHRLNKWNQGALGIFYMLRIIDVFHRVKEHCMHMAKDVVHLVPCPYGEQPIRIKREKDTRTVLVMHKYVGNELYMHSKGPRTWLKKYDCYDLIVTGDNHESFVEEMNGRKLVNIGSLMRTTTDQKDYKPHVFLWRAENNEIDPIPVPIEKDVVITKTHTKQTFEQRMKIYTEYLNKTTRIGTSFKHNVNNYFRKHIEKIAVEKNVKRIVHGKGSEEVS